MEVIQSTCLEYLISITYHEKSINEKEVRNKTIFSIFKVLQPNHRFTLIYIVFFRFMQFSTVLVNNYILTQNLEI